MSDPGARVGLVGPGFPNKGGIARHTAVLAQRLHSAGRLAAFAPWARYRPTIPSSRTIRLSAPEISVDVPTVVGPRWDRPRSWGRTAHQLAALGGRMAMVVSSPAQLPAFTAMRSALVERRLHGTSALIVHNVVPHDAGVVGRAMAKRLVRAGFPLVLHSEPQAAIARGWGAERVVVARLPYHGPSLPMLRSIAEGGRSARGAEGGSGEHLRLLFLGFVRPYKGLDVLLEALRLARGHHRLRVVGEFWTSPTDVARRIAALGLEDRVDLRPGYASDHETAAALADADVLVLPYREATSSQLPRIAFAAGVPVIASDVGDLGAQVHHGVDGILVPPKDPERLAGALDRVGTPGALEALRGGVEHPDPEAEWSAYLDALDRVTQP